jgi:hypothetical protein
LLQVAVTVNHAKQVNPIRQTEVKEKNLLKTLGDSNPTHALEFSLVNKNRRAALRLSGE